MEPGLPLWESTTEQFQIISTSNNTEPMPHGTIGQDIKGDHSLAGRCSWSKTLELPHRNLTQSTQSACPPPPPGCCLTSQVSQHLTLSETQEWRARGTNATGWLCRWENGGSEEQLPAPGLGRPEGESRAGPGAERSPRRLSQVTPTGRLTAAHTLKTLSPASFSSLGVIMVLWCFFKIQTLSFRDMYYNIYE